VVEAARPTVRAIKRKWDGSVSVVDTAYRLTAPGDSAAWLVLTGSRRERPRSGAIDVVERDELWVAVPGEWWVLCAYADAGSLTGYKVHATAPFESPGDDDELVWIDLDLDFEVTGDDVEIEDETQFHDHAHTMGYPEEVVRGAWSGISTIAALYTNGDWPFDGSMERWVGAIERHRSGRDTGAT
jgi:protein associated with RNAse G/E